MLVVFQSSHSHDIVTDFDRREAIERCDKSYLWSCGLKVKQFMVDKYSGRLFEQDIWRPI